MQSRAVGAADHVAVGRADGEEFVEGEDEPAVRQHAAYEGEHVYAQGEEVVDVHDVRRDLAEEGFERLEGVWRAGLVPDVIVIG